MKRIFVLFAFLCSFLGYSQSLVVTAPTLYSTEDAHTYSGSTGTNYGTLGTMNVSVVTGPQYYRSFLKFNLSSIPSNAVITSATLRLTPSGTENVSNSSELQLSLCNTTWTETGITHSSNISNNALPQYPTLTNSTWTASKRQFEIKDWIQAMVEGRLPNYGFRLKKTNETTVLNTTYFTREDATASNRPQLIIQYYLRPYVSAATIVHTSTLSSSDGSISPTVTNGSNTTMNYRWYNSSGTQIATTQNLTGVGKGWYGLKFYGSTVGDTTYQAFIVGTECENVSISFNPGPNYLDDAQIINLTTGSGTTVNNYSYSNGGDLTYTSTQRAQLINWYNEKGLVRFRLWIDPTCQVNTANLVLTGNSHYAPTTTNPSEFVLNTSNWTEFGVAYANAPTYTATGKINLAAIATGNTNLTVDIASFFNSWKTNNVNNFGFTLQLQSFATDVARRMQFHSSDATTAANRPQITFSIKTNTCDLRRKGTSTVTYDATNTYGDVALTITPPSWAVSPYHYMMSEQPIPNFGDIYKTLKDSIFGGVLDSAKFYDGDNVTSLSNSFNSLKQGQYYIAVFDKLGARIYDNLVSINPINYETSANISFANDVFTTSAANGKAVMTDYLTEASEAASITYTVLNNTGESFFGLQNLSSPLAVKTDIYYGFHVQGGSARIINAGVVGGTAYSVTASDEFAIMKKGNYLRLYISGDLKATISLYGPFVYKSGVFAAGSATKIKYKPVHLFPLSWVINIMNPIVPGSCLGSFGQVSGTFWNFNFGSKVMVNPSTVLKNSSNVTQTMDAGATATAYSYSNLLPGNYTLTLTFNWQINGVTNPTPIVYTYNIVVASKIAWENKVSVTDNDALAQLPMPLVATATGVWGHASSVNDVLVTPASTFIDFVPNIGGYFYVASPTPPFLSLITIASGTGVLGFGDPSVTPLTTTVPAGFTGYYFSKTLLGPYTVYKMVNGLVSGGAFTFNAGDKFRIVYTPGGSPNTSLYKYTSANVLGAAIPNFSINYLTAIKKLIGYVKTKNNTGFINLLGNMSCPVNTIYAKLERELKGVKYSVNLNKFYFFYDEEYASTNSLKYNVYDKNNAIVLNTSAQVLTQTISNQPNREHGDNRYYLDVTSLASGSYVLEVINEKEEKFYLRFIK